MNHEQDRVKFLPPLFWTAQGLPEDDAGSALGNDAASSTASITSSILQYRTVNGRTYHSDSHGQNHYWGANDERQSVALDIAHHVFTLVLDDKLHIAPLPEHVDKVIDIGTGTGIWAIDFADTHPDTNVIGTDLSPIQPLWVPPNLSFEIEDFTEPWTFEKESVDFIHARWLVGSVINWNNLFKEAFQTLKPGGWLESYDFDGANISDDGTVTPKTAMSQWVHIFEKGARKLGSTASFNVVSDGLQRKAMEAAGFINITEKYLKIPISGWSSDPKQREIGAFFYGFVDQDLEGVVGYMATQLGWSKEEITVYVAHYRREARSLQVHAYFCGLVICGQKPPSGK